MKVSKIFLALVAATVSSAAMASKFVEIKSATGGGKTVVYEATITPAIVNENNDVQFDVVLEHHPGGNATPKRQEYTASCTAAGGRYAKVNANGDVISEQEIWVGDGPSVADMVFSHACVISVEKLEAKAARQGRSNQSAPSSYTPGSKPGKFAL